MTALTSASVASSYFYDGDGKRVKSVVDGVGTVFVYDASGQLAAEYGGTAETGRKYFTQDHLGSTRVVTSAAGVVEKASDYLPFGEELGGATNGPRVKYAGYQRDWETGLDFVEARYYSGTQGRFTSPDQPLVDQVAEDPQSWNLYTYARNNPLRYVDPTGQYLCVADIPDSEACAKQQEEDKRNIAAPQGYHPVVIKNGKQYEGKLCGDGECVTYVKSAGNINSSTKDWIAGPKVLDLKEKGLAPGTIIMITDGKGHYPVGENPKHAAEFLGFTKDGGIIVREQWAFRPVSPNRKVAREAQPVKVSVHPNHNGKGSPIGDASQYYIVLVKK